MSILRPHAWYERVVYRGHIISDDLIAWDIALSLHHHPDAGLEHAQLWSIWQLTKDTSYRDEMKKRLIDCVVAMADYTTNMSSTFHVTHSPLLGSRGHALLFDTLHLLGVEPKHIIPASHVLASGVQYWSSVTPEHFSNISLATLGSYFYIKSPAERKELLANLDVYTHLRLLKMIGSDAIFGIHTPQYTLSDTLHALTDLQQNDPDLFELIDVCDVDTLSQLPHGFHTVSSYPEWYKMVILHVLMVSPFSIQQNNVASNIQDWFIHDAKWIMNTALPALQVNNCEQLKHSFPLLIQKITNTKSSVTTIESFLKAMNPSSDMVAMCASIATDECDLLPLVLLHQHSHIQSSVENFNNFHDPSLSIA